MIRHLDFSSFYQLIQKDGNSKDGNLIILDVRTPEEYQNGHIKNAVNINFYDPNFLNKIQKLDKNKKYLIYCRSGYRSAQTANIMEKFNFKKLYNLKEGLIKWPHKLTN